MGVVVLSLVAWGLTGLAAEGSRLPLRATLALGAVLQLPLGWWLIRSVGSDRWLLAWVIGMLARLAGVAVIGLVVVPARGWEPEGPLLAVVLFFVATLALEGLVLWSEHFGARA